jgi:hypothetical protein
MVAADVIEEALISFVERMSLSSAPTRFVENLLLGFLPALLF